MLPRRSLGHRGAAEVHDLNCPPRCPRMAGSQRLPCPSSLTVSIEMHDDVSILPVTLSSTTRSPRRVRAAFESARPQLVAQGRATVIILGEGRELDSSEAVPDRFVIRTGSAK